MRSFSPLNLAIIRGDENEVIAALRTGDNISREDQGFTPLMWATWHKRVNIFNILLEHNANIDQVCSHGFTALDIAVRNNDTDFLKLLMSNNAHLNMGREPEFHCAAIHNCTETVITLLKEYKVDINQKDKEGKTALMKAAYLGNLNVVKALLEFKEIDINCKNKYGETARDRAVKEGKLDIVQALDEFVFKKEQNEDHMPSYSPLTTAIIAGDENEVKNLLERKANVNAVEEDGNTPLIFAAAYQRLNIISMLLEYKANINHVNYREDMTAETALSAAIRGGDDTNIVKLLLENKADINAGRIPALNQAAIDDRKKITKMLLVEYKVDINSVDTQGNTALMSAATMGSLATAKTLLKFKNIDMSRKNFRGHTARDRAAISRNHGIVEVLDEAISFRKKQEALNLEIQAAYKNGMNDFMHDRFDQAIEEFTECINSSPDISDYHLIRGIDYRDQNITYTQATLIQLAPTIADAYLQRSIAYSRGNMILFFLCDLSNFLELSTNIYNKVEIQACTQRLDEKFLVAVFKYPEFYEKLKPYLSFSQRFEACGINALPEMLQNFIDPITTTIINDPVAVSSGQTYDRQSLIKYFAAHGNPPSLPDPMTKDQIKYSELNNKTNIAIKNTIDRLITELEQSQKSRLVLELQQSQAIKREKRARRPSFTEEMKQQNEMRKEETEPAQQATTSSAVSTSYTH